MDQPASNPVMTRRALLAAAGAGVAATALTACGGGGSTSTSAPTATTSTGPIKGTIQFSNYPNWIGKHTIADFEKAHPGAKVATHADESSFVSLLPKIKAQPGIYDMALASTYEVQRAVLLGVAEPLDLSAMPNTKRIDPKFLTTPVNRPTNYFIPTDYGKYGIAVRTDQVPESITSWADLWRLAPKYSGRMYWYDFPKDVVTAGLLKLGYKINDKDQAHLAAASKALREIKPHIGNLGTSGIAAALLNGSAVISVTYDYDAYAAAAKNDKVRWIVPTEGVPAYLEGWVALKGNDNLRTVQAFMDYALQPKLYADFLKENDTAGTIPAANRYLPSALSHSPILFPPPDVLRRVGFIDFVGEAEQYYDKAYTDFKAA